MIKLGVYLLIYFLNKTDFSSGAAPFYTEGGGSFVVYPNGLG